jgi:hypothetical protein
MIKALGLIGAVTLVVIGLAVVRELPGIRRYKKISSM